MSKVKIVMIAGAVLFASVSVAMAQSEQKQATIDCLQRAQSAYSQAWTAECVARSLGSNNCKLPHLAAKELSADRAEAQTFCFQAGNAGILKEPIVMPGAGGVIGSASDEPAQPETPRRKFWISPQ